MMDIKNKIKDALLKQSKPSSSTQQPTQTSIQDLKMDSVYSVSSQNWYTAKPYAFRFTARDGKKFTMFLPINPSNLSISTNFATNIIPTLYGTIEEHSEVRYYDIVIEGTTGIAPKYVNPVVANNADDSSQAKNAFSPGRSSFPIAENVPAGGFFSKTMSVISKILDKASDLVNGKPKPVPAFKDEQSGYVAFHNLYRFLMRYKADAAGLESSAPRQEHPLQFYNYKDGNVYDVAIRNFSLRRSAENPMLYYYSIQMRGYNMRGISSSINTDSLQSRLEALGLTGVSNSSMLGEMKNNISGVKSILNAAAGGINILGR